MRTIQRALHDISESGSGVYGAGVVVVSIASFCAAIVLFRAVPALDTASVEAETAISCEFADRRRNSDGRVPVVVVLKEQADLSGSLSVNPERRPAWVDARLRSVAERTQPLLIEWLEQRGSVVTPFHIANMLRVDGLPATLCALQARPEVRHVVNVPRALFDGIAHEAEPLVLAPTSVEPGLKAIGADVVWDRGIRGDGAVVAILDSGVDGDHAALKARWRGRDDGMLPGADYHWFDPLEGADEPEDDAGHGTHIAGTVLGEDRTRQIGVAPDAEWIACRVGDGRALDFTAMTRCLEWALAPTRADGSEPRPDLAPDVIAASWSFDSPASCKAEWLRAPVQALVAAGVVWVASAGNNGPDCDAVCAPGGYEEALTVANYDANTRRIHSTSSRGPFAETQKPDLAAPGANIQSSEPRGRYGRRTGTSMAVPHVVGSVALLLSARPDLRRDVTAIRGWLEETAEFIDPDRCGPRGASDRTFAAGSGLVRIDRAVNAALDAAPTATPVPSATPEASPTAVATPTVVASATATVEPTAETPPDAAVYLPRVMR